MNKKYYLWLFSVFILPFFQGGYFDHQVFIFGLIQGSVLLLNGSRVIRKRGYTRIIFCCALLPSVISAIDLGSHWIGLLRLITCILFYFVLQQFRTEKKDQVQKDLSKSFILSAFLMSTIVIISLLFFRDSELGKYMIQKGRIGGFFQYANSFAAYLFAATVLLFHEMEKAKSIRGADFVMGIVLSMGILMTQSRAMILIYFVFLVFVGFRLLAASFSGLLGLAVGQGLLFLFFESSNPARVLQTNLGASEWLSRLLYYEDGLRMILARPLGFGYLGYSFAHKFYQTGASYQVKFIHNALLQIALDFGLPFLLFLLYGFFRVLLSSIRQPKGKIVLILGTVAYFFHTLVDIDLQFLACTLIAICFLEFLSEQNENAVSSPSHKSLWRQGHRMLIVVILMYFSFTSVLATNGQGTIALRMYPFYTEVAEDLIREAKSQEESLSLEERVGLAKRMLQQNPFFWQGNRFLRDYYYTNRDLTAALLYSRKVIASEPLWIEEYERHIAITYEKLKEDIFRKAFQEAEQSMEEIISMDKYIKELESQRKNNYTIRHTVQFDLTEELLTLKTKAIELYNEMK